MPPLSKQHSTGLIQGRRCRFASVRTIASRSAQEYPYVRPSGPLLFCVPEDRIEGAAYLMNATSSEDSFADLSSRKVTGSSACRYVAKHARPRSGLEKE
ncbi:MAG: hypothetical protein Q9204_001187 [Flavoplaca sp. TL-2023a]